MCVKRLFAATEPAVHRRCDMGDPAVTEYTCNMVTNPTTGKTSNICTCSTDQCNGKVGFMPRRAFEQKYIDFNRVNKEELAKLQNSCNTISVEFLSFVHLLACLFLFLANLAF